MDAIEYRVWCSTDGKWEYPIRRDGEAVPTTCPTNTAHSVDTSLTSISDKVYSNETITKNIPAKGGPKLRVIGHSFTAALNQTTTSYKTIDDDFLARYAVIDSDLNRGCSVDVTLQAPDGQGGWVDVWQYLIGYQTTGERTQILTNEALTEENFNGLRFKIDYTEPNVSAHLVVINIYGAYGG